MQRLPEHTPGPWNWYGRKDQHRIFLATPKRGITVVMDFTRWGTQGAQPRFHSEEPLGILRPVAELLDPDQNRDSNPIIIVNHPDARLIAAAPDLYDACREVMDMLGAIPANELTEQDSGIYGILQRVVSKAEGKPCGG